MQENRKKIGIFLIVLGLILIVIIVYLFFIRKNEERPIDNTDRSGEISTTTEPVEEIGTTTPNDIPRNFQEYDISKEEEHVFNSSDLAKRAKAWAERFGSFNNQSNYGNFSDLKMYMTESFSVWVDDYIQDLKAKSPSSDSYYGIVTHALSSEVVTFNETASKATVKVLTERVESDESGEKQPYYQTLRFELIEVNDEWLIDAAYWEKN